MIDELLTENYGAIKTELWEKALENEIKKTQKIKIYIHGLVLLHPMIYQALELNID